MDYIISSSPHIKDNKTVATVMRDVIIALIPALIGSVLFFSLRALIIIAVSILSCVFFEFLYNLILKKKQTVTDLSAVVTGILLAFCMPVTVPLWLPVIGAAVAIILIKMLFGGIGKNVMNPAIGAYVFLLILFSKYMTNWVPAITALDTTAASLPLFGNVDAISGATPLGYLQSSNSSVLRIASLYNVFVGSVSGCLGETSAILLMIGGLYLLYKKVITWHIPVAFLGTVAIMTFLFPLTSDITRLQFMAYNLFSGGLMLGAIFMATDCTTSPVTPLGKIIYGVGCGLITVIIRYLGVLPEGVAFAILAMNFCVKFIDMHTIPTKFGGENRLKKLINKFNRR